MLWNERFAFGITEVDSQHEKLFEMLGKLDMLSHDIRDGFNVTDDIQDLLANLQAYTVRHFEDEEKLLFDAGYDDFDNHVKEHEAFIEKIQETLEKDLDFEQEEAINGLYKFLFEWVSNHILNTDVKYVPTMKAFLNEK